METKSAHALNKAGHALVSIVAWYMVEMAVCLIKRGSALCQHCGQSNGNRSLKCKACGCPLPKRTKASPQKLSAVINNVSSLLADSVLPTGSEVYFVRVRDQGPDYRYILFNHGSIIIKLTMFINIK